jgi:hypothetical protein
MDIKGIITLEHGNANCALERSAKKQNLSSVLRNVSGSVSGIDHQLTMFDNPVIVKGMMIGNDNTAIYFG